MIQQLIPVLRTLVVQCLDRCSLFQLAIAHRDLLSILDNHMSYINCTYRPRCVEELKDDVKSVYDRSFNSTRLTTAIPTRLTSQEARRYYLSTVRFVDLRYCIEGLTFAHEIAQLLVMTPNVTNLSIQGHWSYCLHDMDVIDDYQKHLDDCILLPLLVQLPLRALHVHGPVWEREAVAAQSLPNLTDLLVEVSDPLREGIAQQFYHLPSLKSLTASAEAFVLPNPEPDLWFPSLREVRACVGELKVESFMKSPLTLLSFRYQRSNYKGLSMLLSPHSACFSTLTLLHISHLSFDFDLCNAVRNLPSLQRLHVEFARTNLAQVALPLSYLSDIAHQCPKIVNIDISLHAAKYLPPSMLSCLTYAPTFLGRLSWRLSIEDDPLDLCSMTAVYHKPPLDKENQNPFTSFSC